MSGAVAGGRDNSAGQYTRRVPQRIVLSRLLKVAGVAAALLLVAATASGQAVVQAGSGGEGGGVSERWVLGVGYDFDFPMLPIGVGVLAQSGTGIETDSGRVFPVRAFLRLKARVFPMPGFNVYLGAGGGAATRLGGDTGGGAAPAGMGFAGFEVGRVHVEVQMQREFHEERINRWVTTVGVTF